MQYRRNSYLSYATNNTCSACISPCFNCTSTSTNCTSCISNYFLNRTACIKCPTYCLTCRAPTKCLSCISTAYLFNRSCYSSSCPPATYLYDASNRKCTLCSANCLNCSNSTTCTICNTSYNLLTNNSCASCPASCNVCVNSTNCTTCKNNSYIFGFLCYPLQCPDTSYLNDSNARTCAACDSSCFNCQGGGPNNCISCNNPLVLQVNQCLSSCQNSRFNNKGYFQPFNTTCYQYSGSLANQCTQWNGSLY